MVRQPLSQANSQIKILRRALERLFPIPTFARHRHVRRHLVTMAEGPWGTRATVETVKPDSRLGTGDPEIHRGLHLVAVGGQRPGAMRVDDSITDYVD